ncbi:MAG TPA: penicillin-binding transpeptidase domain-containing protein [Terriglobales bacterium]
MAAKSANSTVRLYWCAGFLAFWFLAICVRLVWLQVVDYGDFTQRAARQQQRSIEVAPIRGNIYDRNGNELAMTVSVDSIFAVPSEITDIRRASVLLSRAVNGDAEEIDARMRASHAFAWVARKVDSAAAARVRTLNLKGVYFQREPKRFYPKGELASQVLGYVGVDDEGLGGVERQFDTKLTGKPGKMLISLDNKRRWFGRVEKNPDPGENVVLTIDEKIQYIAERELLRAIGDTHAIAGTIIVQNPRTGEILALANWPGFNPNSFNSADPNARKNRAVSDIYEPGSTFKIVTLAAGLEERVTHPDEVVDCQMGSIVVNGRLIHDHKPYGALTVSQVLENSSDVGAIKIALRLGDDRFDRYIRAFGFGSQTGIELPGETRGLTKPVSRWSKVSIGAISMGQEIGVSPIQLISMVSTIANDGLFVPPRIAAGTTPPRSTPQLIAFHPAEGRRVISTMTAAEMKRMLEGVILRGTGVKAILDGYSAAGKTGTAQKTDPTTGRYSKFQYIASFSGFAPVNDPAVSVLVILDSPSGTHEGGTAAAPVFGRVAQQVLSYLNVPHDIELEDQARRRLMLRARVSDRDVSEGAPDYIAQESDPSQLGNSPTAAPISPAPATEKKSTAQEMPKPAPPQEAIPSQPSTRTTSQLAALTTSPPRGTVVLDVGGGVVVPDFHGKGVRTALEEAEAAGIELEVSGSGVGQEQSPVAGARVFPGGHVVVRFGR